MLRKSVFILALLCSLAITNSVIAAQNNWNPVGGQTDWFSGANWSLGVPPTAADWACIQPGDANAEPIIDGDAVANMLDISPWSGGGTGSLDVHSGSCTFGEGLRLAGMADFGGDYPDAAYLYVHSGTVTTNTNNSNGLVIGKPYVALNVGRVFMYGGLISVPRIALQNGNIALYGGTLECTGTIDANFTFYQGLPNNKIDISGGTLKFAGDATTALNALKTSGRIYSSRGTIGTPVFSAGATTLTSTDNDMTQAWNPSPAHNATNVHYRLVDGVNDVNVGVTLTWSAGDEPNVIAHNVYFGTNANIVNSVYGDANYRGTVLDAEGRIFVLDDVNYPATFKLNTLYYWRVDEVWRSSDVPDVCSITKGDVWSFRTHNGTAYSPKPINAAPALSEPLQLSWTAGDLAASTMGHKVYFTTEAAGGNLANTSLPRPTDSRYRGQQTGTTYSLANLAGAFTIVPGNTYYWAIDEVNGATTWKGPVWRFTAAEYVNVDDFEDYNTSAEVQASWQTVYATSCGETSQNGTIGLTTDGAGKHMSLHYSNVSGSENRFTEIRRFYNNGTSFTGNGVLVPAPAAARIDYIGAPTNNTDEVYDRMYVALQDTAGNIGIYPNPDGNAAAIGTWTQWFVGLNDIKSAGLPSVVNLEKVESFMLGFGVRCTFSGNGGDGNMMFDNIRLYAQTCNADYAYDNGMLADLNRDCTVDINDLDAFANDWLKRAETRTFPVVTQPSAPILWYKFDDTTGTADVIDSGTGDANDYTGSIVNFSSLSWKPEGRDGNGCVYLPSGGNSSVSIDVRSLNFMGDEAHSVANGGGGITFSTWINADLTADFSGWRHTLIGVDGADSNDMTITCPDHYDPYDGWSAYGAWAAWMKNEPNNGFGLGPGMPVVNYGTRWNHWAFVKAPHTLSWYCNGTLIRQEADTDANNGDPNIDGPLFTLPVSAFNIGIPVGWGYNWAGRVDDFQVYDYALSAEEIAYIATDGTGTIVIPINLASNMVNPGTPAEQVVNFADTAEMCTEWRTQILWP